MKLYSVIDDSETKDATEQTLNIHNSTSFKLSPLKTTMFWPNLQDYILYS